MALLRARGLRFAYDGRAVLDGLTLDLPAGVTLVCGEEGSGKTTLLRLLAGVMAPQSGGLESGGASPSGDPDGFRRRVLFAGADDRSADQSTPPELFAAARARWPAFDDGLLAELVEGFSLAPHLGKKLFMLSTGSRRKVWLAAAFAARAPVTIIDDPYAGLDRPSIRAVDAQLAALAGDPSRACVIAAWEAPQDVPLALRVDLPVAGDARAAS